MSLCRFALRHAAVEALRGQTLVGENVKNSDFRALDIAADGALRDKSDKPFLLIYTDDAAVEGAGSQTLWENGLVEVVIESGIATAMASFDEETGETTFAGFGVAATDAGMEAALDMIDRQVATILHGQSEWSLLFASMHDGISKIERKRATLSDSGTRLAARQIRMWVEAKGDPAWGAELAPTHYAKRFELAVAGSEVAGTVANLLGSTSEPMTYEQIRARYGLSDLAADVLLPRSLYPDAAPVSRIEWVAG